VIECNEYKNSKGANMSKIKLINNFSGLLNKVEADTGRYPSVSQLASDMGIERRIVRRYMDDEVLTHKPAHIIAICSFFGCTVGELLYIQWEGIAESVIDPESLVLA